jgi:hypothetical protein
LLSPTDLENLLNTGGIGTLDRLLCCLAVGTDKAYTIKALQSLAKTCGWPGVRKINASAVLGRSKGLAIRASEGWKLTTEGKAHVGIQHQTRGGKVTPVQAHSLRTHLQKLTSKDTRAFVEEAVACFEGKLYRSAVVLSWVGAIAVIYDHVVAKKLDDFNQEALRRDSKWHAAKNSDGLGRMSENDFLQICQALGVVGKNVKEELEACLKLRNGCGHPNSLRVAESRVAAHIETLMLNVFDKF